MDKKINQRMPFRQSVALILLLIGTTAHSDCLHLGRFDGAHCRTPSARVPCDGFETRGLFTSCHSEYFDACIELASTLLASTQVPITVFVAEDLFREDSACQSFTSLLKHPGSERLMLVPVVEPAKFMRDPGMIVGDSAHPTYLAFAYGMMGAKSIAAKLFSCEGFTIEEAQAQKTEEFHRNVFENDLNRDTEPLRAQGGNILQVPKGPFLVGQTSHPISPEVLQVLKKHGAVVSIPIPDLKVGHIDEVFALVPAPKDPCHAEFLAASPAQMRTYLDQQSQHGHGEDILLIEDVQKDLPVKLQTELARQKQRIATRKSLKRPVPRAWRKAALALARQVWDLRHSPRTIRQILADKGLMQRWDSWQNQIDGAKKRVSQALHGQCETWKFRDVPVLWTSDGRAPLSNPVNGLHVNGTYIMSKPHHTRFVKVEWRKGFDWPQPKTVDEPLPDLEAEIRRVLHMLTVQFTWIPQYDNWGGNVHCATLQAFQSCPSL